ncbi:M23 family metallopeptidase [Thalassotalea mangrovi]|uniref:M23 family metallopeptidase n=1 Tax=Thalassotalea mangrovi TaxID=2572245 RepID=A0A4U1BAA2_9GAMM|nr:M23 family metallopeptidase [Thalassotalea mangrovi]TKB47683.1 M23 family metallopeptidase [Thalassotalea mangrovi]
MSLTVLYRGKNVRFSLRLSKARWVAILASFTLLSGLVIHWILKPVPVPVHLQAAMVDAKQSPESDFNHDALQITTLTARLAELQSHVLRLNALAERLAKEANIPEDEFNMSTLPSSGGPLQTEAIVSLNSVSELETQLAELALNVEQQQNQFSLLESLALGHHIEDNSYLSGRPITKGWLSSYYGVRKDPFNGTPTMHKGVDFAGKENAEVIATGSGVVSWASERYGYGNLIEIDHGTGFKTRYGHNSALLVKVGDVVSKGQVIARMGSTGRSTGPHVHYEILRANQQINPIKYVYRKPKK